MEPVITKLYCLRFQKELHARNRIWKVLCREFFQNYIKKTSIVCDIGAGYCEFINNIQAREKIAIDINPQTARYAEQSVKVIITSSVKLPKHLYNKTDVVFASNFFEHLPTKEDLTKTLIEINKILKPKGQLIILMPNIRHIGSKYWDFLDHQLPLTDHSMVEGLQLYGFEIIKMKSKFLPYSTKSRLPKAPFFVSLYLKLSLLHLLFGKQSLIIAIKSKKLTTFPL